LSKKSRGNFCKSINLTIPLKNIYNLNYRTHYSPLKRGLGGCSQLHEYFKTIISIIPIEEFDIIIEIKANVLDGCAIKMTS